MVTNTYAQPDMEKYDKEMPWWGQSFLLWLLSLPSAFEKYPRVPSVTLDALKVL